MDERPAEKLDESVSQLSAAVKPLVDDESIRMDSFIAKEPQATVAISNLAIRKPFIFLGAPHPILTRNVK